MADPVAAVSRELAGRHSRGSTNQRRSSKSADSPGSDPPSASEGRGGWPGAGVPPGGSRRGRPLPGRARRGSGAVPARRSGAHPGAGGLDRAMAVPPEGAGGVQAVVAGRPQARRTRCRRTPRSDRRRSTVAQASLLPWGCEAAGCGRAARLRRHPPGCAGHAAPLVGCPDAPRAPSEEGARARDPRRRPTLPGGCPPSTIGAGGLHFRVRNGNGCFPAAIATGNLDFKT